jgi:hypothetical protein
MTIKKQLKKFSLFFLVLLVLAALTPAQQNLLLQTTLAAAIPSTPSTNPFGSSQTFIQVAAVPAGVTGITLNPTTTLNQQSQWQVYVDRELMNVVAINGTTIQVQRGVAGTVASPHASGTMALFGRSLWFYVNDPGGTPGSGAGAAGSSCVPASILVSPYLNVRTGAQWLCSSITNTWVPGWNNAGGDFFAATATVASVAGTTVPSGPIFTVTGVNAIVNWGIPLGFNGTAVGGGCFTTIPTAIWTWTAAGNITTAGTVTAGNSVPVTFCWNAVTSKWVPSRIA